MYFMLELMLESYIIFGTQLSVKLRGVLLNFTNVSFFLFGACLCKVCFDMSFVNSCFDIDLWSRICLQ